MMKSMSNPLSASSDASLPDFIIQPYLIATVKAITLLGYYRTNKVKPGYLATHS